MNSNMDRRMHHECVQRAVALGRGTDPAVLPELIGLLKMPSAEIRRLAASAIGKLSGFGADPAAAVAALAPIALHDPHPQTQQYALTALKAYGTAALPHLADVQDIADNPRARDYVRNAAASAAAVIREAESIAAQQTTHLCRRCGAQVSADEFARAQKAFHRIFCDKCFDEVFLDRRNFDTKVELNKTIRARDGTLVQSGGERIIADYLREHGIGHRYDERIRIVEGYAIRPDFYLPEFDVYIEYWGMDTADYKIGMLKKQKLYQQEGKRVISIYPEDKATLDEVLRHKLGQYIRIEKVEASGTDSREQGGGEQRQGRETMSKSAFYAHSKEGRTEEEWQRLSVHLKGVAERATDFARATRLADNTFSEVAYWAGMLHDIGKYTPEFQSYLRKIREGGMDTHHAIFGASMATTRSMLGPAFSTAGHHAGLHDSGDLQDSIANPKYRLEHRLPDVLKQVQMELGSVPDHIEEPAYVKDRFLGAEYYIRMLFSCLVDADYLDTETACMDCIRQVIPLSAVLDELITRILKERDSKSSAGTVNQTRHAIFERCQKGASSKPGFFTLTVPTGGGKTLSGMAFALAHAKANDLRRIIVVIPYLSIIEQNAAEYRRILDPENRGIVIEHHSAIRGDGEDNCDRSAVEMTGKLAAENWDAPIIVTTSVQFIESLFANRPSACRKLHNIARSVVVLDEVQTLPMHLLTPLLSVLRELKEYYGVSFVFCTATQPAFRRGVGLPEGFKPGEFVEIGGDDKTVQKTFCILDRVRYERVGTLDWASVAQRMSAEPRILCVVNTRKHAFELWEALRDAVPADERDSVLHLSSALCAEHRFDLIGDVKSPREGSIRHCLLSQMPCRVVSTQVVEAGVDLDFPVVFRAMAPLDSIVQAAGRCNREGQLKKNGQFTKGRVVVFVPKDGGLPSGVYKTATGHTEAFLANQDLSDLASEPVRFADYFTGLFGISDTDHTRKRECTIQEDREALRFREVARKARVIADDTMPIVTPYNKKGREIIAAIRERKCPPGVPRFNRHDQRRLQRYTVNLRRNDFLMLKEVYKAVTPLLPNLDVYVLDAACYHPHLGVIINKWPTEELCGV